jgi:hypothetical protein
MAIIDPVPESLRFTSRRTFADAVVGKVLIMYSHAKSYPDDEWEEHCRLIIGMQKPPGRVVAGLVVAPFAGPNAKQRNLLRALHVDNELGEFKQLAMCVSSYIARAATFALQWWLKVTRGTEIRAYKTEEIGAACAWLAQFTPVDQQAVEAAIEQMRQGCNQSQAA